MSGEILIDALPYIDAGYEETGVKQSALVLVEEECKRFKASKNYLEIYGPVNLHMFETEIMKNEFERMESRQPMEMLSMKRYELPPPPQNKLGDPNAWLECVENSYAQLEHQATRIVNLEVMSEYGSNAWRMFIQILKTMLDEAEKQLERISKQIQAVNLNRKSEQTMTGEKLKLLEHNWVGLVSKNYEIECALVELEKELHELRKRNNKSQAQSEADDETNVPEVNEPSISTAENEEANNLANNNNTNNTINGDKQE